MGCGANGRIGGKPCARTWKRLSANSEYHIDNLDAALHIISRIGVLYHQLERKQQKKLLREVIDRIVVDAEGTVIED